MFLIALISTLPRQDISSSQAHGSEDGRLCGTWLVGRSSLVLPFYLHKKPLVGDKASFTFYYHAPAMCWTTNHVISWLCPYQGIDMHAAVLWIVYTKTLYIGRTYYLYDLFFSLFSLLTCVPLMRIGFTRPFCLTASSLVRCFTLKLFQ